MTEKELEGKAIKHVCSNCGHFERTGKITCDSKCECFHFYIGGVKEMQEENEHLKEQIKELKAQIKVLEDKDFEKCPFRYSDVGCDYCDWRDRDLKYAVENDRN